jgi:hypothetical protein
MDEKTKLITMAVCGVVISAALIASFFAISITQQAVAQGNKTGGGGNATSAGGGGNATSAGGGGNATSASK